MNISVSLVEDKDNGKVICLSCSDPKSYERENAVAFQQWLKKQIGAGLYKTIGRCWSYLRLDFFPGGAKEIENLLRNYVPEIGKDGITIIEFAKQPPMAEEKTEEYYALNRKVVNLDRKISGMSRGIFGEKPWLVKQLAALEAEVRKLEISSRILIDEAVDRLHKGSHAEP